MGDFGTGAVPAPVFSKWVIVKFFRLIFPIDKNEIRVRGCERNSHQAIRPDLIRLSRLRVCCQRKFIDERKKKNRCGHHKFQTFLPAVIEDGRPVKVYRKNRESFGEWLVWLKISRKLGKLPINWSVNKKS